MHLRVHNRTGIRAMAALAATLTIGMLTGREAAAQGYRMAAPPVARTYTTSARPATYAPARPTPTYRSNYATPGYYAAPAAAQPTAGDYDGAWFLNWLNGVRAQHGLAAVGYDPSLASWAAANSAEQTRRGLGHFVMGPARRQNSAMGSAASLGSMWMNSPAHRAALLDPSIRWIGLAGVGAYWTFNAR